MSYTSSIVDQHPIPAPRKSVFHKTRGEFIGNFNWESDNTIRFDTNEMACYWHLVFTFLKELKRERTISSDQVSEVSLDSISSAEEIFSLEIEQLQQVLNKYAVEMKLYTEKEEMAFRVLQLWIARQHRGE